MHSLKHTFLNQLQFSTDQMATLRSIGEYQGRQTLYFHQSPEVLESLREVAVVESTESSNRIENITAPFARIKSLVLKNTKPKNRSEQEVAGYRDALALIHESGNEMSFTPSLILQIHANIYRYMSTPGGKFKSTDNDIIEKLADGTIRLRFKPTPAHLTADQMNQLTKNYKSAISDAREPLVIIPLAILDFLCIHPFTDGNGRMARLLTLMLLYHFDYQVGKYISLERIFEQSKETYYETLETSSQHWHQSQHDVMPWLNYFWGVLIRAYREFEDRVGTLYSGRGSKTELVKNYINKKTKPFSIGDLEKDCPGVSRETIRNVLRQLRDEGKILSIGKGRGAQWSKT